MPVTKKLSYQWYNTPNIHFCTVTDFETLCEKKNIRIETREFAAEKLADKIFKEILPNLFSDTAIYLLTK
jgi:methionine biosynthesis protein MetW